MATLSHGKYGSENTLIELMKATTSLNRRWLDSALSIVVSCRKYQFSIFLLVSYALSTFSHFEWKYYATEMTWFLFALNDSFLAKRSQFSMRCLFIRICYIFAAFFPIFHYLWSVRLLVSFASGCAIFDCKHLQFGRFPRRQMEQHLT